MNKDFMMGAELALKGAGIQDDRIKQDLMSKLTNAQIAKLTQDLDRNTGFQKYAEEFQKAGQTQNANLPDTWGGADYLGANVKPAPGMDSPEFLQGMMKYLEPPQAATALIAQGTRETPQEKFNREVYLAHIKGGIEKDAKFREFETVLPNWKGKKGTPEYGAAYNQWQKDQLSAKTNIVLDLKDLHAPGQFKPGTLDYMVERYETDGVIPPFGMGAVGAKQRAAFFDKAAERAASRGDSGALQAIRGADFKSSQSTLTDLTKREQLIKSFDVRINDTANNVLIPIIKKWDLQNPRYLNWPVNKLAEIMGSGDLAAMKLALNSVSTEVGKVEFNALGIQQLTDSAAKFMNSVHDWNMPVSELLKVLDTSKALTKTGSDAISNQRKALMDRMKTIAPNAPGVQPSGGSMRFNEGGKIYNIPSDKIPAFKAKHPQAQEVR